VEGQEEEEEELVAVVVVAVAIPRRTPPLVAPAKRTPQLMMEAQGLMEPPLVDRTAREP
jgi:hypothetical protein